MSAGPRILTIEDDSAIRRGIVDALRLADYQVSQAGRGDEGFAEALATDFDLLLLDLVLPGQDGLEILDRLREQRPTLPIIVLTARGAEADRVGGLKAGADDYIVKPFSVQELLARVEAVLRRSPQRPTPVRQLDYAHGQIDFECREIRFRDGSRAALSERESELLLYLARHPGRVISREEILSSVWRLAPRGITTRTIDMHIARLRDKLRDDVAHPEILRTVRGKGYQIVPCHE